MPLALERGRLLGLALERGVRHRSCLEFLLRSGGHLALTYNE